MRLKKLIQLEEFLKKGIFLIKGPPSSGKTTMADLFEFYLNLKDKNSICLSINVNNVNNMKELDQEFMFLFKKTPQELIYNNSHPTKITYVIIDQAHSIFGDKEGEDFEPFWKLMKEVAEGTRKEYIRFLLLAVYSINKIDENLKTNSPLILEDKFEGFNFLKFSTDEYNEIINFYHNTRLNEIFPITQQIKNLIWQETEGFPSLMIKTITYFFTNLNNSEEKTVQKAHEVMYSVNFRRSVIHAFKGFSEKILKSLSEDELRFLIKIHLRGGSIIIDYSTQKELYNIAKKLEKFGLINENSADEFKFPTRSLSSAIFDYIFREELIKQI